MLLNKQLSLALFIKLKKEKRKLSLAPNILKP